jgi:hypothetical protein
MRENEELRPLGDGCADRSSLEVRAGDFLHQARPTSGLSESQIAAIADGLFRERPVRWMLRLAPALTIVVACLLAGTVTAVVGGWRLPLTGRAPAQGNPQASPARARTRHAPTPRSEAAAQPLPFPESSAGADGPAIATTARPAGVSRRNPRPESILPQPTPPLEESRLSSEARSLADALTRWRRDNQAESALALLAAHDRRFPQGALAAESKVARAEILLTLGRQGEALFALDRLALTGLPRARELQTIRGELRARAGRCSEARRDLSAVMAVTSADDLGRRAARATAQCP